MNTPQSLSPGARRILLAGVILAATVFMGSTLRTGSPWGGDFAMYVLHAQNLAEGRTYTDTGYVYDEQSAELGPRAYPPGFPILLAPVVRIAGSDLQAMKLVVVASHSALLVAVLVGFGSSLSLLSMLTVLIVMGFHPWIWSFKDSVVSDLPFAFFFLATLVAIDRAWTTDDRPLFRGAGIGLLMGFTYLIRTAGIVLPLVAVAVALHRNRKLDRLTVAAVAVSVTVIGFMQIALPEVRSYTHQLIPDASVPASNVPRYLRAFGMLWDNGVSDLTQAGLAGLLALAAVIGFGIRMRKGPGPFEIVLPLYLAIILVWPAFGGTRFVLPILGPALVFSFLAVDAVAEKARLRQVPQVLLLILTTATLVGQYTTRWGPIEDGPHVVEAQEMFDFVRESIPSDDVVMFRKPRVLSLYADQRSASLPLDDDPTALWEAAERVNARWMIADTRLDFAEVDEAMDANPSTRLRFGNSRFRVYRVVDGSAESPGLDP